MKKINDSFEILKNKIARNRIVMPPMDTLMAYKGYINEFHIQHYGCRSYGGVGTIIVESTAVMNNGLISEKDIGIWDDKFIIGLSSIARSIKMGGAIAGIQLNHAGAKAELVGIKKYGTSLNFYKDLDQSLLKIADSNDLKIIEDAFVNAAQRAKLAGFDFIELHGAHGYFLSNIISRITNEIIISEDIVVRSKLVIDIAKRIKQEVNIPMGIRISFGDHVDNGMKLEEYFPLIKALEPYVDYFHVSSGETISKVRTADLILNGDKLFRLPIAREIKKITNKNVIVVGNFRTRQDVDRAFNEDIDAVAMGRELLMQPYAVLNSLLTIDEIDQEKYNWNNNKWFNYKKYKLSLK